jgi:hypothetical protein
MAESSSTLGLHPLLDQLPFVVQIFVVLAVLLHIFAFAAWGFLFIKEQKQTKLKSKEF